MRISRVNTLAAYLFLLLTISIPLVLYNKVTKSKAVHTYMHNLQDKCRIPSFKKYMQTVKYNLVDQFMTVFSDIESDKIEFLHKLQQAGSGSLDHESFPKFHPKHAITDFFEVDKDYSQDGQSKFIDKLFNQAECLTFVDIGAADGIDFSNSLYLETTRKWHGYLIEANPDLFTKMASEDVCYRPNSIKINACVGPVNYEGTTVDLPFNYQPLTEQSTNFLGGISMYLEMSKNPDLRSVYESHFGGTYSGNAAPGSDGSFTQILTCVNLEKMLPNNITIDYLSIDTEGSEIPIIESLREEFWTEHVKSLSVDVSSAGGQKIRDENSQKLQNVMMKLNFRRVAQMKHDDIFVNVNFENELQL